MKPRTPASSFHRRLSKWLPGLVAAILASSAWLPAAWACKIKPHPDQFPVDATLAASLPAPPVLSLASVTVRRSQHAPPGTGDCADVGSMTLQFVQVDGSRWPAGVGVRLAVTRGALPQAFAVPSYPLLTTEGELYFGGGDDPSQPMDFTLQATAVNAGGVESLPIEIHVSDAGRGSGCAIGGRAGGNGIVVVLACLALCGLALARARRRGPDCFQS
jgi:hypothetical protein